MKKMTKKANDKFHTIYTVVMVDGFDYDMELSTVSFEKFDDAVDYCLSEIGDNSEKTRKELCDQMYYNDGDMRYYIEEANLIH